MPNLVCPGFAKSGTTLLHGLLDASPDFEGPWCGKERSWFRLTNEPLPYEEVFANGFQDGVVSFEFSPTYLAGRTRLARRQIAERIKAEIPDAHIVLAIRHPLHRAVSHYLHQLQRAALFGNGRWIRKSRNLTDPYAKSFEWAVASEPALLGDYAATVEMYFELFGPEKCVFFFLEEDAKNFVDFYDQLRARLGLDPDATWRERPIPRVGDGGVLGVPRYFVGGTETDTITTDGKSLRVPAGSVYIASDLGDDMVHRVDPLTGRALNRAQELWTSSFDLELLEKVYETDFRDDLLAFDQLVRPHSPHMPNYLDMALKTKSFDPTEPNIEFVHEALEARRSRPAGRPDTANQSKPATKPALAD